MNRSLRRNTRGTRRGAWPLIIAGGICVVLAAAIMAQTKPRTTAQAAAGRKAQAAKGTPITEVKPAERKPLSYYTSGVRGDLFVMPGAKEQVVVRPEPPKVETTPPAPEVIDPFADYAYTGTVVMGDEYVALVENAKTKEGTYLRRGDQFMGGTVGEITDKGLTVMVAGSPRTLNKTDEFKLTPLDKDAAFRTQTPGAPGQPGMPGMGGPFGMPGMPGGGMGFPGMQNLPPDVQQRIQQRFQGMSPEQMQQMRNRFMNRSFEGGQRRRRFF